MWLLFLSDVFISFPLKCCDLHFRLKHEICLVVLCASYDVVMINSESVSKQPGLKKKSKASLDFESECDRNIVGQCMFWILNIIGIGHNLAACWSAPLGPHCVHMPIVPLNGGNRRKESLNACLSSSEVVDSSDISSFISTWNYAVYEPFSLLNHFVILHLVENTFKRLAYLIDMHVHFF